MCNTAGVILLIQCVCFPTCIKAMHLQYLPVYRSVGKRLCILISFPPLWMGVTKSQLHARDYRVSSFEVCEISFAREAWCWLVWSQAGTGACSPRRKCRHIAVSCVDECVCLHRADWDSDCSCVSSPLTLPVFRTGRLCSQRCSAMGTVVYGVNHQAWTTRRLLWWRWAFFQLILSQSRVSDEMFKVPVLLVTWPVAFLCMECITNRTWYGGETCVNRLLSPSHRRL